VGTDANSKASDAVRETRNITICPLLHPDPAIECGELTTVGTSILRTNTLRGCSFADFVRHECEFR